MVGQALGQYQVVGTVGAGGMGIVYRAHDPRLNRDVAIKVLPPAFSSEPDRLRRFEHEARAAAALNHPNILAVYDVGTERGSPFIVSELLKGENLRQRLQSGPIPRRKAIDYGLQIARGLAAAHDAGIVHRDLKPENIFVTDEGLAKILDFGLAKLSPSGPPGDEVATRSDLTSPGQVLGTVGYMSPEQVRGAPTDARSDIFSLGAILYELFSGHRAFQGASPADTLSAILNSEPPPLSATTQPLAPVVERLVLHCLEKKPADRFQSARDIAFTLEASIVASVVTAALEPPPKRRRWAKVAVAAAVVLLVPLAAFLTGRWTPKQGHPRYHQVTYRPGTVFGARFMPDGQNIVYAAAWQGDPTEMFTARYDSVEWRPFGVKDADLLAISSKGDVAILTSTQPPELQTVPFTGGTPRPIESRVLSADFGPDGRSMAIIHTVSLKDGETDVVLDYPQGTTIYRFDKRVSGARMNFVRVSRDGTHVAFVEQLGGTSNYGKVVIIDTAGNKLAESKVYGLTQGLSWPLSDDEVWFSAAPTPDDPRPSVAAMDLKGRVRIVLNAPAQLLLKDISKDGRLLLSHDNTTWDIMAQRPGESAQQNLTWFGWSYLGDISDDGQTLVFIEAGNTGGDWGQYLRKIDGSPAVRIGDGAYGRLTPDGRWVVTEADRPDLRPGSAEASIYSMLRMLPVGPGTPQDIKLPNLTNVAILRPLPDGTPLINAAEPEKRRRTWVVPRDGRAARPVTPEGIQAVLATPDGRHVFTAGRFERYPLDGGPPTSGPKPPTGSIAVGWDATGTKLYLAQPYKEHSLVVGYTVSLFDPSSGKSQPWANVVYPGDRSGLTNVRPPFLSADGKTFAYSCSHRLSQLFVVENVR